MNSVSYRSCLLLFSLLLIYSCLPSVGQELTVKSGSVIEKRIPRGQIQEVKVINTMGNLQWQQSKDGINWTIWSGKTGVSVVVLVNENIFLRCAIQEANCDRVYSDAVKLVPFDLATLTTKTISEIRRKSAISGGNIISDGGDPVQQKGVCWSLNQNPTITDPKTIDGNGTAGYSSTLSGLTPETIYYVRAYAINNAGTAYGNPVSFMTDYNIVLPSLTTVAISGITQTTAISGGNITSNGGDSISARGVCWSVYSNPTTAGSKTNDGTGTGVFSSNLSGLTGNTTYYVRSYATNSAGTRYGNEINFKTSPVLPAVTTTAVTLITQTTAASGGNVTSNGGANNTVRGICWSTSDNPTTADKKTTDGTGTGIFISSLTGLTANTIYYVRAYATNSAGTVYGNAEVFTTLKDIVKPTVITTAISAITQTTATGGGDVTDDGGSGITARGVCWDTETDAPTTDNPHTTDGTGIGFFTSNLTGLTENTRYFIRAYATNSAGTSFGTTIIFITSPGMPVVITTAISAITQTTASSGGNVTSDGGAVITARGICWATSDNPTTADNKTNDGTGTGPFISSLIGLTAHTSYYVRAYATNNAGTAYGNVISFTSLQNIAKPTVNTTAISAVTQTTATGGGEVTNDGGAGITARGVCWAPDTDTPTMDHPHTSDGPGSGVFTSYLTGLTGNTRYFIRAYATNSEGTSFGSSISFITSPGLPQVTTTPVSAINLTSASSGGNVTSDGGANITARGICWSTSSNPTTADNKTNDGTGTGSFISNLTGLTPNTHYFVRSYATNIAGTVYGNVIGFTTLQSISKPTVTTASVSGITSSTAIGGGDVTSDGGSGITARGVCWAPDTDLPTTDHPHTTDGSGNGIFTSNLTGLTGNTRYFVRAYATNSSGTSYGNPVNFTTSGVNGSFIDTRDGHVYKYVMIGSQTWMAENLAWLPSVSPSSSGSETTPHYYVFSYEGTDVNAAQSTVNYKTYGAMYNWTASLTACPSGWYLPTDEEWKILEKYLGMTGSDADATMWRNSGAVGGKLKETGTAHWVSPNIGATNTSGFTAIPGDYRSISGGFYNFGEVAHYWTSTEVDASNAWNRYVDNLNDGVHRSYHRKGYGFLVRCLRN